MLELYLQVIIYGIYIGSLYGLAAVGLGLMFGVMDILQIAHGSIVMLGGYFCFWLFHLYGIDPLLSLPLVAVVFFLVGIILFKGLFAPVTKLPLEDKVKNSMLVAFGLILVLDNLVIMVFTGDIRTVAPWYQGLSLGFLGIRIPHIAFIVLLLTAILTIGLKLFLNRTYLGKSLRATAQNPLSAALSGVNVIHTYVLTMAIGTALGAIAGVLVLLSSGIDPAIGMDWTLKSLLIVVLAGTGNIGGIFLAGLFFGILEGLGSIFIGAYKEVIGLVLFFVILLWKPKGIFSKRW